MRVLYPPRPDGSFVIEGALGSYHVTHDDPLFAEASAAYEAQVAAGETLPPEGDRPGAALHGVQHRLYPTMPLGHDADLPAEPTLVAITLDADPAAALERLATEAAA